MHRNRSIPLRRRPPPSLHYSQDELLSDEYSGFLPIRVRKSSPEAPVQVAIDVTLQQFRKIQRGDVLPASQNHLYLNYLDVLDCQTLGLGQEYVCTSCQWH